MREKKRLEAWIDGAALTGVDGRILLRQIEDEAPQIETTYGDIPGGGRMLLNQRRVGRRLSIVFALRELYDLPARARIIDAVNAWAQGEWLEVSYRPDQRMRVRCVGVTAMGSARDVHAEYRLNFDDLAAPYWEDKHTQILQLGGTYNQGSIYVPGTADAIAEAQIVPTAALNAVTLNVGNSSITLNGLNVQAGSALTIDHDDRGLIRIAANGTGKISCRTPASDDDLIAHPGQMTIGFSADAYCAVTVRIRGRWL